MSGLGFAFVLLSINIKTWMRISSVDTGHEPKETICRKMCLHTVTLQSENKTPRAHPWMENLVTVIL